MEGGTAEHNLHQKKGGSEDPAGPVVLAESVETEAPMVEPEETLERGK